MAYNTGTPMIDQSELRLSAQRALLGRIHLQMRLVKVKAVDAEIIFSVSLTGELSERLREDVSEAAAEIIADFPQAAKIHERYEITDAPIPAENVLSEGWIFRRAE